MSAQFTVVVAAPDVDSVAAGALAGRAAEGRVEPLVFDSGGLVGFFASTVQQRLPRSYDLVLCGLEVVRTDWDGRPVRAPLMDALRAFLGPIRWFGGGVWDPEDVSAVAHVVGEGNLIVCRTPGPVAALVRDACFRRSGEYEDCLVRLAAGRLSQAEEEAWGAATRLVLAALKAEYADLSAAVALLMEARRDDLIARFGEQARRTDADCRRVAGENAEDPRPFGELKLTFLTVPQRWHRFWAEVSAYARGEKGAELSLCHLEGRPVLVLARNAELRVDLRVWAGYVTDTLPTASAVGGRPDAVPLLVRGLAEDCRLREEVLGLLAEGAHLLKV
jgi:hypothetical protein